MYFYNGIYLIVRKRMKINFDYYFITLPVIIKIALSEAFKYSSKTTKRYHCILNNKSFYHKRNVILFDSSFPSITSIYKESILVSNKSKQNAYNFKKIYLL